MQGFLTDTLEAFVFTTDFFCLQPLKGVERLECWYFSARMNLFLYDCGVVEKLLVQMDPGLYFFINQGCLTVDNMDDKEEMDICDVSASYSVAEMVPRAKPWEL